MKKNNNLTWDEYFNAIAQVTALRSKDPNTKVGALLVKHNKIIGTGYNGMPKGNDDLPWHREGSDNKYNYVIHAEMNAILNATQSTEDTVLYVSLFPCSNCAKHLVQAGIKEVVYNDDKYMDTDDARISLKIFNVSGVVVRKLENHKTISLD